MKTNQMNYFLERYQAALASGKPYALVTMNIKKFRYINYKYGREAANEILKEIEEILAQHLTPQDSLCRVWGDNYVILKQCANYKELEKPWVYPLVDDLFEIQDERMHHNIYTSFGFYMIEDASCSFEEAYEKAEFSRIHEKNVGLRVFTFESYRKELYDAYMKECDLEEWTAMAREKGLYQAYIQPKVDLKTRQIVGGETLVRLRNEQGAQIPVSEFLPILNKNGYIRMVDMQNCERVLSCMEQRIKEGKAVVPISFNVSNSFFHDEFLVHDYKEITTKYDIDPHLIEMEFMESITSTEKDLRTVIDEFHKIGYTCSLDDYGNGFSNFNAFMSEKFDVIKIDRCFFQEQMNEKTKIIVKMLIDLIHSLDMHVIAEGVERQEDIDYLEEVGCDMVQGFYFYRPMPLEEFFQLLDEKMS